MDERRPMPRALVVYFSQGGTTARVARRVATGLEKSGFTVHLHNLSQETARRSTPPDPAEYDLLGVGSPTHYYRLPSPVSDFLAARARPRAHAHVPSPAGIPTFGIPTFGFLLCGTYSGWAGRFLSDGLSAQGGACIGLYSCRGADRYMAYLRKGYLFSAGHPTAQELTEAHAFGLSVGLRARAAVAHDGPTGATGPEPAGLGPTLPPQAQIVENDLGWVYRLERRLAGPWLSRHVYSRLFRVDAGRCTSCGACVRRCPNGNVKLSPSGLPTWGRACLFCLYCQMVCTEEAIASPVTWPPFDVLVAHNVRKAAADPALDRARVVHEGGRTRVL